ncbi:MAG: hypothetical protein ACTSU5_15355 [Promethearchaeota archaeon]
MKVFLLESTAGLLALGTTGELVDREVFEDPVSRFPEVNRKLREGEVPSEYASLLSRLREIGVVELSVEDESLVPMLSTVTPLKFVVDKPSPVRGLYFQNWEVLFPGTSLKELDDANYIICREVTAGKIKESARRGDKMLVQAIAALDEVNKSLNVFYERLREWFGLHFPELTDTLISNNALFANLVFEFQARDEFSREVLEGQFKFKPELVDTILDRKEKSMGAELGEVDRNIIHAFTREILSLENLKAKVENYLDRVLQTFAPNTYSLVGSLIGARLIALAGSLKKLSSMPASRIQLLGAERALFRSLKSDASSPKHGVIFQWPRIRGAKPWLRGKISRALAGKLAIAARIDYFEGEFIGGRLKEDLLLKIQDIEARFPQPPPKKKEQARQSRGGGVNRYRGKRRPPAGRGGARGSRSRPKRQAKFTKRGRDGR